MEAVRRIPVSKTKHSAISEVDWNNLSYGTCVSDHMFICRYKNGDWHQPQVVPFQDISLPPTALALHYGQAVFEGMKAFRMQDNNINIFRLDKHHDRLNRSLERMCMPVIPYDLFAAALSSLAEVDKAWVPDGQDTALYIRPLVFASEGRMGVRIANEYIFVVMTAPVPLLYPQAIKVKAERHFIRAAHGGTGYAKCAGNYGGAFYAAQKAQDEGFDNILWLDAVKHEYIEESGTMNLLFVLDSKLVTPPLSDTILDGITRDALLQLAGDSGITVEERPVSITEIIAGFKSGTLTEAFGAGTAAVVAPISVIGVDGVLYHLPPYNGNSVLFRLKRQLEAIRSGAVDDLYGWNYVIPG